jgi:hypothetical protein
MPEELFEHLPEPRPFLEDGSQFGISRAAFETMDKDEQRELMRDWFFQNFEDPVNSTPRDDETREYIFLRGGPYDAKEQLWDKFGEVVSEELIDKTADEIERDGTVEWAPASNSPFYYDGRPDEDEADTASLPGIPLQGPGPHFEFNNDGTIDFAPPTALDREGNNLARLQRLHPALRDLARQLSKALAAGNAPHGTLSGRVEEYRKRIDQPVETLDFTLLYVEGVRLANAENAARDEIARGELPPLPEAERETLQTLLEVHGTFMLSTRDGAELIAAEERYQRRPKAEREYQAAAIDFAQSLQNQPAIITPDAAAFVLGAAEQISRGANPERSGVVGTSVIQNVAVVLAAGAVVAALPIMGNAIAGADGLVIGGLTSLLASESLKKSKPFATVIAPLITKLDQAAKTDFSKIKQFLISIEGNVRKLAQKHKNFRWLDKTMDWITPIGGSINLNLVRKVTELPLSLTAIRILQTDNIVFIGDLVQKTEIELLQFPGCGRQILNEILENLALIGLHLGMKIIEWPPENIEYVIEQLKIMDQSYPSPISRSGSP